jgi:hypothetical protein
MFNRASRNSMGALTPKPRAWNVTPASGKPALFGDAWAEKVDTPLEAKDREIAELRERLQRLLEAPYP